MANIMDNENYSKVFISQWKKKANEILEILIYFKLICRLQL